MGHCSWSVVVVVVVVVGWRTVRVLIWLADRAIPEARARSKQSIAV